MKRVPTRLCFASIPRPFTVRMTPDCSPIRFRARGRHPARTPAGERERRSTPKPGPVVGASGALKATPQDVSTPALSE